MIIFGTRGVNFTKGQGNFFCPQCNTSRKYRQVNVRRFFTLYFIPLIPLDALGSYVECTRCRGTFRTEILSYDPQKERELQEAFQAEYMDAIKNVMLLIMMADGVMDQDEVTQVQNIYHKLTGKDLDSQTVAEQGKAIVSQGSLEDYVATVVPLLNLEGRLIMLRAAMEIAAADGEFQAEEQEMIASLVKQLELPKAKANAIIDEYFKSA